MRAARRAAPPAEPVAALVHPPPPQLEQPVPKSMLQQNSFKVTPHDREQPQQRGPIQITGPKEHWGVTGAAGAGADALAVIPTPKENMHPALVPALHEMPAAIPTPTLRPIVNT